MNWIDVNDRLPVIPKGKYAIEVIVAVFDYVYDELTGNGYSVTTRMYNDEDGFRELVYGNGGTEWVTSIDPVIYWMYKPDPPTKKPSRG